MKQLLCILIACLAISACGKKGDLKVPPAPGEMPAEETE